ncbi:unnamed protein product [Bursaphelenchus xylophilus]|uniref:(pine wood nematode) hypothetical protein n=1 Tax=Bursaphelenchus xylophilus TaxID=6326 RepID=A0A1I7RR33_BURXY|nr:unnamed protein product [Bursaphelenchus xylophilus]CAG9130824.1 unnamed protein product [Bursaphelenchus xylophilus]
MVATIQDLNPSIIQMAKNQSQKGRRVSSVGQDYYPHSSLVRRARLIRRSTTNQYCEHLKQLQKQDDNLIKQIFIIKLKPFSQINDFDKSFSNGTTYEMVPTIDFSYPPIGNNVSRFQPAIFYPDFMKYSNMRREDLESYPVVLTDEKGERTFAYCYKFIGKRKHSTCREARDEERCSVLVLISHVPNECLFHQLATDFVNNLHKDSSKLFSMSKDLLELRMADSNEAIKKSRYVVGRVESRWTKNLCSLVEQIGVENCVFGFLCLLAEKRILITGSNVSDVSRAVQSFVRLLAPLEWPYTLVPVVPDSQSELCYNPTPYICGIMRYNLNKLRDLLCPLPGDTEDEIVIIDVERGIVLPCLPLQNLNDNDMKNRALLNWTHSMGFPKTIVMDLLSSLKSVFPIKTPLKADEKIEKKIMVWYARIFGHYTVFGNSLLSTRNRKRLAMAHPSPETREMLQWFTETGILQSFFFNQTQRNSFSSAIDRFEKIRKKYAPPVDKNGKRKKARSLVWRIFHH